MARIPIPPTLEPRAISGDRLTQQGGEGFSAPGRALASLGGVVADMAAKFQADNDKIEEYNSNLALEKWSNEQAEAYQVELEGSQPDGSDFLPKRTANLSKSFETVKKGLRNPEHRAKADLIFERTRGSQAVKGFNDVNQRRKNYVATTTDLGIDRAVNTGQIQTEGQFNDYFETVVKPKIDTYITDPVEREVQYAALGAKLGKAYLEKSPQIAATKQGSLVPGLSDAVSAAAEKHGVSSEYLGRLAMVESGGGRNLANDSSSARGPFQFVRKTARQYGINPMDFAQSADGAARLTKDNADYLRSKLGREPSPGELYLAHQQGMEGAFKLLSNPNALAVDVVGQDAVRLNGGGPGMTAGQFASKWVSKFEQGNVQVAPIPAVKPTTGMWAYVGDQEWQQATTKAERIADQKAKDIEAAEKLAEDELVSDGYDLIANDTLTAEWIEDSRQDLSPALYHTFKQALEKQETGGETDTAMYLHLFDRAVKDPDQNTVQDDAFRQFSEGKLKKSDFNRIFNLSRSTQTAQSKPWENEIRKTLGSRLAPLDREDTAQYEHRLDGLFAFDDWKKNNPNATREEMKKKANEIAKEYTEGQDLRSGIDMPQYTTVGRYNIDSAALQIAAQKLLQAHKAGKLSSEDLARETAILKRWSKVLEEEARNGQ